MEPFAKEILKTLWYSTLSIKKRLETLQECTSRCWILFRFSFLYISYPHKQIKFSFILIDMLVTVHRAIFVAQRILYTVVKLFQSHTKSLLQTKGIATGRMVVSSIAGGSGYCDAETSGWYVSSLT